MIDLYCPECDRDWNYDLYPHEGIPPGDMNYCPACGTRLEEKP